VGSLEVLPDIVDAVGDSKLLGNVSGTVLTCLDPEMKIIFDSGIRTGADIFKAISLGAHAVQVGRMYVWGMAHEGESGCRHVMKSLLSVSLISVFSICLNFVADYPCRILTYS